MQIPLCGISKFVVYATDINHLNSGLLASVNTERYCSCPRPRALVTIEESHTAFSPPSEMLKKGWAKCLYSFSGR